ncbi:MAG: SurA N-terminal domain-containing protein [Thermodesulfovibrionales bacterium]|nr:SurA N-terminal domain-containing protein [Thermodesulfovibrionales bacterium]
MQQILVRSLLVLLFLSFFNCSIEASENIPENSVVAEFNGEKITYGDFKLAIYDMEKRTRRLLDDKEKQQLLDDMINARLIHKEALKRQYDKREDVIKSIEDVKRKIIINAIIKDEIISKIKDDDDTLKSYFEKNIDKCQPKILSVQMISLSPKDAETTSKISFPEEARKIAIKILERFKVDEKAEDILKDYKDLSTVNLVNKSFDTKNKRQFNPVDYPLIEKIEKLSVGDVDLIEHGGMLWAVKLTSKQINEINFPTAKGQVMSDYSYEQRQKLYKEFVDSLRKGINIKIDESLLK